MKISVLSELAPSQLSHAAALPLCTEDISTDAPLPGLPKDIAKGVREWVQHTGFNANAREFSLCTLHTPRGRLDIFLLGCGPRPALHAGILRVAGGRAAMEARRLAINNVDLFLSHSERFANPKPWVRAFTTGFIEGTYHIRKSANAKPSALSIKALRIVTGSKSQLVIARDESVRGAEIGGTINRIRDIANRPGNEAPPRVIARESQKIAKSCGLKYSAWNRAELKRQRCNSILAVAQGSKEEPYLIQLTYPGRKRKLPPLVVVGKTITFDTGGISLKPGKNMEWMKFDKSGGMAVLAFMSLVGAVLKPDRPVIGLLAAAENMPGSTATRPGDVITSRNGKTIEIINTDAEGRLVLADALDVASGLNPACIIDFATLTGAALVALGRQVSAIMSNHAELSESLQKAGERTGDRLWPLPLYPEYAHLLNSPFADVKNIGDGTAGTIIGGMFLKAFVKPGIPWAHIDLTSAWEERPTSHGPAGATLFGAALLAEWLDSKGPETT